MAAKSVRIAAKEAMQRLGYDPLEVLVSFAQAPDSSGQTKLEIAQTLLPYMYPKLSNMVLEAEVSNADQAQSQAELFRRVMENPELADAAAKLSLAAAEAGIDGMIQ